MSGQKANQVARKYVVQGSVQGVGFRWFVERVANSLGLAGYVKNLYKGDVEVYAIGEPEALDQLRAYLERGPRGAYVTTVLESAAPLENYRTFRITF